MGKLKFIDLFAGIGGIRKGFELACKETGISTECVFTSEIKPYAIDILKQNNPKEEVFGDITKINSCQIPDFDILLAGFPCQAFSSAGKRLGFEDTRGTLFFEVARILSDKHPIGFILENVEGLVTHDKEKKSDKIGKTFSAILKTLTELGYKVSWKILNAKDFGVPQERKRIYIVGSKEQEACLDNFPISHRFLRDVLEKNVPTSNNPFVKLVLSHYSPEELFGKSIKDKRGGNNNIHSWDIEYKGHVTDEMKELLSLILKERRKKKWASEFGIDWMDGMPLTLDQIKTFYSNPNLEEMLKYLVEVGYLKYESPKRKVGNKRVKDESLPKGYNIVAGKMSFEISKVLNPADVAPTLVAMDMQHLYVPDFGGIRKLTLREGLNLFGYPSDFNFNTTEENGYDLLGNTVVVPVIKAVSKRLLDVV